LPSRANCWIFLTVLAGTVVAQAAPGDSTDRYGDPLPAGALVRLGTVRLRHSAEVRAIAFSPDGKYIASGGDDKIRLWDVTTGRLVRTFGWPATSLAFSLDGRTLVAQGTNLSKRAMVWDVATGETLYWQAFHGPTPVDVISTWYSAFVLIHDDENGSMSLLDVLAWETVADFAIDQALRGATSCVSPDGGLLAWGLHKASNTSSIHVWSVYTRERRFVTELDGLSKIMSLAFAPDGRELVTAAYRRGPDGVFIEVCSWDAASGEPGRRFTCGTVVGGLALSPNADRVACASRDEIAVWDVRQQKLIRTIRRACPVEGWSQRGVIFSPDGKTIASTSGNRGICLWDVATGQPVVPLPESCTYAVTAVAIAPDAKQLATGSRDGVVRIWSGSTGKELRRLRWGAGPVDSIRITSEGKTLAACGFVRTESSKLVGQVKLWDLPSGELRHAVHRGKQLCDLAMSADDTTLAVASRYWGAQEKGFVVDLASGKITLGLPPASGQSPYGLTFSLDGNTVSCLTFSDFTIRRWDLVRRQETATAVALPPRFRAKHLVTDAVFVGHRDKLVGSSHDYLHVIDAATGELLRQIKVPTSHHSRLALSPNGRLLARGGRPQDYLGYFDRSIQLYDLETGREVLRLEPLDTATACLRFSRDGKYLVTGMYDGTTLLWDIAGAYHGLPE
jgi:WD40 repeat protein